jgi:hypothetical protein
VPPLNRSTAVVDLTCGHDEKRKEPAQRLLSEVIENASLPGELGSRAIVRLGRTDWPVPEAVEVLARQCPSMTAAAFGRLRVSPHAGRRR